VVFNYGKPRFSSLFLAGVIFGLYEAYITKVIWDPYWGTPFVMIGGVAVIETIILILFWHSVMAFIIPLFLCENILTKSRSIVNGMPHRMKRVYESAGDIKLRLVFLAILFGVFQSSNSPSPIHSIASGLSTSAVLIVLVYIWRTKTRGMSYSMKSLLPCVSELRILVVLLLALYLVLGFALRMEALPMWEAQAAVWLLYAIFFTLLFKNLRRAKRMPLSDKFKAPIAFSWKWIALLVLIFTFTSAAISPYRAVALLALLLTWFLLVPYGIYLLAIAIIDTTGKSK
jgi:hypothetical protein